MALRHKVVSGAWWLSGSTAITALLNFAQTVVLSQLLTPRDFGLTAMIWVFLGFAQMLADTGMSAATVQRPHVTPRQLSSIHWSNVIAAAAMALLCWTGTPLWVAYYREPDLAPLVPWAALAFVLTAAGQQFQAMAQRSLEFNRLALANVSGAVASLIVATIVALMGGGAFSLVFAGVASCAVRTLWLTISGWRQWHPSLHWVWSDLEGFVRFGAFQLGDRVTNYAWNNVDYMIVGRVLGSEALGYYRLAFETVLRPLATINPILNTISFPVFARQQGDREALRRNFVEMNRLIAFVVAPIVGGLCAVAPLAVPLIFGSKWMPAAVLIQILSPMGLLRAFLNASSSIVVATGAVERIFRVNLALAIIMPIGFWWAARWSLEAVCWTGVLLLSGVMAASWRALHTRTFGLSLREYLTAIARPAALVIAMSSVVYATGVLLAPRLQPIVGLSLCVGLGVVVYLGLVGIFERPYLKYLLQFTRPGPPVGSADRPPSATAAIGSGSS